MAKIAIFVTLVFLSVALFILYWHGSPTDSQIPTTLDTNTSLKRIACSYTGFKELEIDCYHFKISNPGSVDFQIPIAVFGNPNKKRVLEPLVLVSGGPGQTGVTNSTSLEYWYNWAIDTGLQRDFVVYDIRGAAPGEPRVECEKFYREGKKFLAQALSFEDEYKQLTPVLLDCAIELEWKKGVFLNSFTSSENASDIAEFMKALNYQEWSLMGVSYGTRVALVAALSQPQVKSLILDSPYPLEINGISSTPMLWKRALDNYFLLHQDKELQALFWQVFESLGLDPLPVEVEDWSRSLNKAWLITDERLVGLVYGLLYDSTLSKEIPTLLHELLNRKINLTRHLFEFEYNYLFDPDFSPLLYMALECNDNSLFSEQQHKETLKNLGKYSSLFEKDWQLNICKDAVFEPGQLPPMAALDLPVLVAVGALDPVTTVEHAQGLMPWLSNGYKLELESRGHAQFNSSECGMAMIPWFLNSNLTEIQSNWSLQRSKYCL